MDNRNAMDRAKTGGAIKEMHNNTMVEFGSIR
jgi:hypothetical protein